MFPHGFPFPLPRLWNQLYLCSLKLSTLCVLLEDVAMVIILQILHWKNFGTNCAYYHIPLFHFFFWQILTSGIASTIVRALLLTASSIALFVSSSTVSLLFVPSSSISLISSLFFIILLFTTSSARKLGWSC